ncbi:MAG TPA: DUF58 domain-containing protein [Firmicutes bacterium]|jgi:uncharacterized protein (DUF58 family)|nr:DUF58 domain-containing protein [Bacillota bacterium]
MGRNLGLFCFAVFLFTAVSFAPAVTLYLLTGLLLVTRWGQKRVTKKLQLAREVTKGKGFVGNDLEVKIRLVNPTWFPVFWCTVYHSFSQLSTDRNKVLLFLPPGRQREFILKIRAERRGIYDLPPSQLVYGDPWGLTEQQITVSGEERIMVFPTLRALRGLTLTRRMPNGPYRYSCRLYEDPTRLQGCREYLPGDSLKKIHWPNVARTGSLQVKEWETTLKTDYGIFLNLREKDLPVREWYYLSEFLIELAASLLHCYAEKDENIGFYCNGKAFGGKEGIFRLPPKRGKHQEEKILSYLAGVSPGHELEEEALLLEAQRLPAGSVLLFLTPVITQRMVEIASRLRKNGFQPVFLWPYFPEGKVPATDLKNHHLQWHIVRKGRDWDGFTVTPGTTGK